jgi:phosphoglucomutase
MDVIDSTFSFMTVDWDGQIRMDPSSVYAMARMVGLKERFDVAFASDTDADRHGIVSRSHGCSIRTTISPSQSHEEQ